MLSPFPLSHALKRQLRHMLRDENGSIAIEAVIILPVLVLFYLVSFTFYDAYRKQTVITKAGYTISDMLSRQDTAVSAADIDGLAGVFNYITRGHEEDFVRVTAITRFVDAATGVDEYRIIDSYATNGNAQMTDRELDINLVRIPILSDNETVSIIETYSPYVPPFFVGLDSYTMESWTVTRQRSGLPIPLNVPPLPADNSGNPPVPTT